LSWSLLRVSETSSLAGQQGYRHYVEVSADASTQKSDAATLSNLLYPDATRPRVTESDWVNIVRAIATGNQLALQTLYGRTHRIVFTLIMRIVNNRDTAEELTLDVFHDVWRRAGRYDASDGTVVGWIMNQARSRAIDRIRFEHRKKRIDPDPQGADVESATSSEEPLEAEERGRAVRNAVVAVLTPEERQVVETAFFKEHSYAEVAFRLNQPLGTVKTRVRSAMLKLRRALATELEHER
jgi:RNA polymerase sigma-70 factor, ECF subfamily